MKRNPFGYTNFITCLLISLAVFLLPAQPMKAQTPPADLRLLAWSPDGTFLLGATPGPVVTLPDGSRQQLELLWRLDSAGTVSQQLAQGVDPQRSPDSQLVIFQRPNAQNQMEWWGIDMQSGALQPVDPAALAAVSAPVAGDPPGRIYPSPDGRRRAILVNEFFTAAVWVGQGSEPARPVLQAEGEIFSDLAWRPDGQALALIRAPLGSQIDSAGELWRVDLAGNSATQLSQNNVADRSPVWSGDGRRLSVIRNGQVAQVPADQLLAQTFAVAPPLASEPAISALAQLTPPATIRVIHHASNTCRNVPVGQIDTIPFEEYVKRVVPYEVFPSWPAETLKAQAVAARTYGWDKYLQNPGGAYHVTDWINHQYMCDNTFASTNQAVDATAGEYLAYNGQMITAMFSAENSSPTKTNPNVNYLLAVDDPVSFGKTLNGHGYGMGQWGAQRWAAQHNWSYQAILRHYYSNVTLERAGSGSDTTAPNVSLVTPWSNHYVTGNRLRLLVNTSDDSGSISQTNVYLSTPSETNLLVSENGPANPAGYVVDVSAWGEQALLAGTLALTAEAFDATGKRGVSPPVTIGLDRVSPTGLLTTAATLTPSAIITDSPVISLTLTGSDATAGVTQITLGRIDWLWEGENLTRQQVGGQPVGQMVSDAGALNGQAMRAATATDPAGSWSSAGITLPAPKQYRAYFRIKVGNNSIASEVARLEAINAQSGALMGLRRLYATDVRSSGVYQEFGLDFDYKSAAPVVLRLTFLDIVDVWLDRVVVVEYPAAYTSQPDYGYPRYRLKLIDGAGNVSNDLLVMPALDRRVYLPLILRDRPDAN